MNKKSLWNDTALWRACTVVAMVLAFSACGGGGGDAAPAGNTAAQTASPASATGLIVLDASTSCDIAGFKDSTLQQINAARAEARNCGTLGMPVFMPAAPALAWNDILFSAAARHGRDMAQQNYFAHTSLDGRTPDQRVSAEGYVWQAIGENLAAGYTSIDSVIAGWLSSPGHCRNLMDPVFADVAVSCVQQAGTTFGTYWTMELGKQ
ncbi:MAG: CAP domain-containing protein [Burkholderiaceae bacterium]